MPPNGPLRLTRPPATLAARAGERPPRWADKRSNVDERTPHPSNVTGPFYVLAGCCTTCGVPELARGNFGFESDGHCYVKRQPQGSTELEVVLRVVRTQELGCIRYRGADETILRRLAEAGEAEQCDVKLLAAIVPLMRNHATFSLTADSDEIAPLGVLEALRSRLLDALGPLGRATTCSVNRAGAATVAVAWFEQQFHRIELSRLPGQALHLEHAGPLGLSELLDDVLRAGPYSEIVWSTSASGDHSAPRPW